MIPTPFRFEDKLKPADFQKIGQLSLRWSHIDHTVGNCLRVMLHLTPEEAVTMVFSLSAEQRRQRIREMASIKPLPPKAAHAFGELDAVMKGIQPFRNNVIHAILLWTDDGSSIAFHLRSKLRTVTKEQAFETEELTNYAAIAVLNFRFALGEKQYNPDEVPPPLPDRPDIPEFLRPSIRWPRKSGLVRSRTQS